MKVSAAARAWGFGLSAAVVALIAVIAILSPSTGSDEERCAKACGKAGVSMVTPLFCTCNPPAAAPTADGGAR